MATQKDFLIPMASPYPWPDSIEDGGDEAPRCLDLLQRQHVGAGMVYLQTSLMTSDDNRISNSAKHKLMELLNEHQVTLKRPPSSSSPKSTQQSSPKKKKTSRPTTIIDSSSMTDDTILQRAGDISLLGSLLSVIDGNKGAQVSSKRLIAECVLAVDPRRTNGKLDGKEMVLAALHFMAQEWTPTLNDDEGDKYPSLPLIRPISITNDLERRNYEKACDWDLQEILPSVFALEERFYNGSTCINTSSSSSIEEYYKWMGRERFLPVLDSADERRQLMLRGDMPSASVKIPRTYARYNNAKKQQTKPAPPSPSPPKSSSEDQHPDAVASTSAAVASTTTTVASKTLSSAADGEEQEDESENNEQ